MRLPHGTSGRNENPPSNLRSPLSLTLGERPQNGHTVVSMANGWDLTRAHERLREELDDDGVILPGDPGTVDLLLLELHHARRPPVHEQRSPVYGSMVLPNGRSLVLTDDLVELVDLGDLPLEHGRRFADGRSSYLVHSGPSGHTQQLALFRRSVQYEADLVEIQSATGAIIVQRTGMGAIRIFGPNGVIEWSSRNWVLRPSAEVYLPSVRGAVPEVPVRVLCGMLDLCIHWLSPAHIGATLLLDVDPREHDDANLDLEGSVQAPDLSVNVRHHFPALFAVLQQSDLAALVSPAGKVTQIGVGLRSSRTAETTVVMEGGMRHRSAARYTWDHQHTVAFVVSEDGPVTVFRRGEQIAVCSPG